MKFDCIKCGECCMHIRGNLPEEEKAEFQALAFGKLPIIQVISVRDMSFPIWNFEYKQIQDFLEKNMNKKDYEHYMSMIKPARIIFDLNSNKTLIVAHCIMSDECVFLDKKSNNSCKIYDVRPLVCKQFPFQSGPLAGQKVYFGNCPANDKLEFNDAILQDKEKMLDIYGESYLAAAQKDIYMDWVNRTVMDLFQAKKLRPAMNYPYPFLMKRYEMSEKILFTDFLVDVGFMTAEEVEKQFAGIKNNKDAKKELGFE
ncbi:MAG: YkgJ family cysteine cluster protein [Nanoarchaeota archaeon]|nr:YkgJ family cysteine cluster protein [Nanoarchaeota archaeon]